MIWEKVHLLRQEEGNGREQVTNGSRSYPGSREHGWAHSAFVANCLARISFQGHVLTDLRPLPMS